MRKAVIASCLAVIVAIGLLAISSASPSSTPTIVTPDAIKWSPLQGMAGAQQAVLLGDPSTGGSYTMRIKLADGVKLPAHYHPADERATVLSGALLFVAGDKAESNNTTTLPAGSFVFIPAGTHHFIVAKGETVVQTTGTGPFKMTLVH